MAEEKVLNGLRVEKINSILNSMRDDKEFLVRSRDRGNREWFGKGDLRPRRTCASTLLN